MLLKRFATRAFFMVIFLNPHLARSAEIPYRITPELPAPGQTVTVHYRAPAHARRAYLHYGFNGWNRVDGAVGLREGRQAGNSEFFQRVEMARDRHGEEFAADVYLPTGARALHFVFCWDECTAGQWDNNAEQDYALSLRFPYSGPFLTWNARTAPDSGIVVTFETDQPAKAFIEYGETPSLGQHQDSPTFSRIHHLELTGLAPETTYYYRVGTSGNRLSNLHSFRTGPSDSDAISFVVLGDIADNGETPSARRIAEILAREHKDIDLVIGTGNLVWGNRPGHWWTFFDDFAPILSQRPFLPVMGSRDPIALSGEANTRAFMDYFTLPYYREREPFYTQRVGPAEFLALNSNAPADFHPQNGRQYSWLKGELALRRAELAASDRTLWTFAFWHVPPFSAARSNRGDSAPFRAAADLFPGVLDWQFSGHDRLFQRSRPLGPHGIPLAEPNAYGTGPGQGVGFLVAPSVGLPPESELLEDTECDNGLCRKRLAFPQTQSPLNATPGFVRVDIRGEQLTVSTYRLDSAEREGQAYLWDSTTYRK